MASRKQWQGRKHPAAHDALKVKCTYKAPFVDSTLDPLESIPVEKRYGYVMQLAKQVASRAALSQDAFKSVVHRFEDTLRGMSGFAEEGSAPAERPAKKAKQTAEAGPSKPRVQNPLTGRGPGRPKTVNKDGMNGCAPAGRGPGRPAGAGGAGGGVAAGPARAKMGSRGGSSGGQRRYKSSVEMSKMQKGKGKGKGLATD